MSYGAHPGSPSSGAPATSAGAAHGESFTARAARIPGGRLKQVHLPGGFPAYVCQIQWGCFSVLQFDMICFFFQQQKPKVSRKKVQ